jgi:hypothetical protein
VWSVLWDLYDAMPTPTTAWPGFRAIWNVLIKTAHHAGLHQHFQFHHAVKTRIQAAPPRIDTLVAAQNTSSIADIWGTGETMSRGGRLRGRSAAVHGHHHRRTAVIVRNVDDAGTYNTLGNHRYLRFNVASTRSVTVTAASSNPKPAGHGLPGVARRDIVRAARIRQRNRDGDFLRLARHVSHRRL